MVQTRDIVAQVIFGHR